MGFLHLAKIWIKMVIFFWGWVSKNLQKINYTFPLYRTFILAIIIKGETFSPNVSNQGLLMYHAPYYLFDILWISPKSCQITLIIIVKTFNRRNWKSEQQDLHHRNLLCPFVLSENCEIHYFSLSIHESNNHHRTVDWCSHEENDNRKAVLHVNEIHWNKFWPRIMTFHVVFI